MSPPPLASRPAGVRQLLLACGGIAAVWLVVLPAVGRIPQVAAYIAGNEARGIDPSAKFYTEVPCMPSVVERMDSIHRTRGHIFWMPGAAGNSDRVSSDVRRAR